MCMAWLTGWGSLRYPVSSAFFMLAYIDARGVSRPTWECFAAKHLNYLLGANEMNTSYLAGAGKRWFKHWHHRGAHGSWNNSMFSPQENRHINYELLGGPDIKGQMDDSITNYGQTEGGNDMQIGLVGLTVALAKRRGGRGLGRNFPAAEIPGLEFWLQSDILQLGPQGIQVGLRMYNNAGWPPRSPAINIRYYMNISSLEAQGLGVNNLTIQSYYNEGARFGAPVYGGAPHIWYVPLTFDAGVIYPQSTTTSMKQVQISVHLPYGTDQKYTVDFSRGWVAKLI